VSRYHQAILLPGLALTGIVLGQVIRRVRKIAREYAARIGDRELGDGTSSLDT
jgi:hypothetical protein